MNYQENFQANYSMKSKKKQEKLIKEFKFNEEWQRISDSTESNLIKKVTYYKYQNRRIIAALKELNETPKSEAIFSCGTYVKTFRRNGHEAIKEANFCRQRLCQVCAWRRSAKFTAQMIPVMKNIKVLGYKFLFVTLTIKNPQAEEVKTSIDILLKGWDKFLKRRKIKRVVHGYARSIEITYNKRNNTYHPHIHALLVVDGNYSERSKDYIYQQELCDIWQECIKVDYKPIVDIRIVKKKKNNIETVSAAIETLKYAYKVNYKEINTEVVGVLLYSLAGRRLVAFGGIIENMRKAMNCGEIDDNLNDKDLEIKKDESEILYLFSPAGWRIIDRKDEIE